MSTYNIFIDGVARKNHGAAGIGIVINGERGQTVTEWGRYLGISTHNAADYLALIEALEQAVKRRVAKVITYTDSKLLLRQVTGQYRVKNKTLKALAEKVDALAGKLNHFEINYINKQANKKARQLAEEAITGGVAALLRPGEPVSPAPPEPAEPPPVGAPAPAEPTEPPPVGAPAEPVEAAAEAVEGVTWRVLAFTPKIMLVQFNYKKGAKIPVHRHIHEQAVYIIKGRVKYTLADKEVILTPGLGITIQGNSDHGLEAERDSIEITTYAPMRGDLFRK
ncbi:MAG: reverse transcriptase-like protein [Bacillota bacterium]